MIHPVDAPLVFSSRRHLTVSDQSGGDAARRTVYSARSSDTGPVPTSPQIRDEYRPVSAWSQMYRSMGRMPVTADQQKSTVDQFDSIDPAMAATIAAVGNGKSGRSKYFKNSLISVYNYFFSESDTLHFPAPVQTPSLDAPLELKSAELNIGPNCKSHRTEEYYVAQRAKGPQLVLRRGAEFLVNMTFYRAFDPTNDILKLVFEIGKNFVCSKF